MKCDICHKYEASVYIEDISNNKVSKKHICMHCAMGIVAMNVIGSPIANVMNMLKSGAVGNDIASFNINKKDFVCPSCGTNYEEVEKNHAVGCPECYETFKDFLDPIIFKNGYKSVYRGKYPLDMQKTVNHHKKLLSLKSELEDLLEFEDFEQAAKVRDEIKREKRNFRK